MSILHDALTLFGELLFLCTAWLQYRALAPRNSVAFITVKSPPTPPATLGSVAVAGRRVIVWCRGCGHQAEPDGSELAERYGAATTVLDWKDRLICSRCDGREIDMVLTGARR